MCVKCTKCCKEGDEMIATVKEPKIAIEEPDEDAPEEPAAPRRPADVADLDVLREEAEHEISKRRSEAAPIESQAEFGLAAPEERQTPSRALRARMARLRGEDDGEDQKDASNPRYTEQVVDIAKCCPRICVLYVGCFTPLRTQSLGIHSTFQLFCK